ncbi:MAG: type-F conjugative transfer system secretin TraK [Rhodospirillales bacterium]|nr:type-F conjugative transfer system secretin TraK [Rhodospirillales bacterium]
MNMYRNPTTRQSATGRRAGRLAAALAAACVAFAALPGPVAAMQMLEATDHAELEAAISATGVSRVALAHDRIRRVIRSPGGFDVEHDAASGDLYLRSAAGSDPSLDEPPDAPLPVTLFLGTERGFTYRLTLAPDARPSAQVLVRNPAAAADPAAQAAAGPVRDARVAELVRLVRAVARRERLPGYAVEPASGRRAIGTWRGARFTAQVLAAGPDTEAGALAQRFGTGVAAVWVASPPGSTDRERMAVVVTEPGRAGVAR